MVGYTVICFARVLLLTLPFVAFDMSILGRSVSICHSSRRYWYGRDNTFFPDRIRIYCWNIRFAEKGNLRKTKEIWGVALLEKIRIVKPVLKWANACSPEHTSDTSTNYDSFLNWTFSLPNMVWTVQTLLHSLACNEMQALARTCGRRAADSMIENVG